MWLSTRSTGQWYSVNQTCVGTIPATRWKMTNLLSAIETSARLMWATSSGVRSLIDRPEPRMKTSRGRPARSSGIDRPPELLADRQLAVVDLLDPVAHGLLDDPDVADQPVEA